MYFFQKYPSGNLVFGASIFSTRPRFQRFIRRSSLSRVHGFAPLYSKRNQYFLHKDLGLVQQHFYDLLTTANFMNSVDFINSYFAKSPYYHTGSLFLIITLTFYSQLSYQVINPPASSPSANSVSKGQSLDAYGRGWGNFILSLIFFSQINALNLLCTMFLISFAKRLTPPSQSENKMVRKARSTVIVTKRPPRKFSVRRGSLVCQINELQVTETRVIFLILELNPKTDFICPIKQGHKHYVSHGSRPKWYFFYRQIKF